MAVVETAADPVVGVVDDVHDRCRAWASATGFSTIFWKIQGWFERRSIFRWTTGSSLVGVFIRAIVPLAPPGDRLRGGQAAASGFSRGLGYSCARRGVAPASEVVNTGVRPRSGRQGPPASKTFASGAKVCPKFEQPCAAVAGSFISGAIFHGNHCHTDDVGRVRGLRCHRLLVDLLAAAARRAAQGLHPRSADLERGAGSAWPWPSTPACGGTCASMRRASMPTASGWNSSPATWSRRRWRSTTSSCS